MAFPLGTAIGSAASVGLGIYNDIQGKKVQQEQNEYNERMIDKQNAYNSPQNQMRLLKDAGLNPNAILQGNTLGGAIQQQANQSAERPRTDWSVQGQTIANLAQDADLKAAQAEKLRGDLDIEKEQLKVSQGHLNVENQRIINENMLRAASVGLMTEQKNNLIKTGQLIERQIDKIGFDIFQQSMNDYWNRQRTKAETLKLGLESRNVEWTTRKSKELFPLETRLLKTQANYNDKQAGYLVALTAYQTLQNRAFEAENFSEWKIGDKTMTALDWKVKYGIEMVRDSATLYDYQVRNAKFEWDNKPMFTMLQLQTLREDLDYKRLQNYWFKYDHGSQTFGNINPLKIGMSTSIR